jgi:ligand-binding sensor domain-containing protein
MRAGLASMKLDRKRNSIWINTTSGLFEFSLKSKQFRVIDALNEITKTKDYHSFFGIDIDRDGRVWFATNPHGIFIYDPETNQAHKLFSDPKLQKVVSEQNLQLYIDRDGIVWTSYFNANGIYELFRSHPLKCIHVRVTIIAINRNASSRPRENVDWNTRRPEYLRPRH